LSNNLDENESSEFLSLYESLLEVYPQCVFGDPNSPVEVDLVEEAQSVR